ncbi:MAG: glucose-6-phosphate isomerase [Planctomycetes bacterium]|nr:glucose-6-phosphate isomerase [Planctomycetota bacterium]
MTSEVSLDRILHLRHIDQASGIGIDVSGLGFARADFDALTPRCRIAFAEMSELEAGAIANPNENRRVGHYWLRTPELAPTQEQHLVTDMRTRVAELARRVLAAEVFPPRGGRYRHLLLIGIGGSVLGPQLLADALGDPDAGLTFDSFDNTDPDGMQRLLRQLDLAATLFVVVSKSGSTKETRNGMSEARAACTRAGIDFTRQAIAITGADSELDGLAKTENWIARLPMEDWVGGRTSVTSAVGLFPAALLGIDIDAFMAGARAMDESTRRDELWNNPAALLAAAWLLTGDGVGTRHMVVLPYRDRLQLFARYLQQLVMESLGKELDRQDNQVFQGLTVLGNKGSTDQHAYVQQLRDGRDDFFACFIRVLHDGDLTAVEVEPGVTSADYLQGFLIGTRRALSERKRPNMTITLPRIDAQVIGALIALFERAVGLYASLIDINAYHQPGVEAGKRAATKALELRARILDALASETTSVGDLAAKLEADAETCLLLLEHLAANTKRTGVVADGGGYRRK